MKRLQQWFDQIAGVTQDERDRQARAREIFATVGVDISRLTMPACWRRQARVRSAGR